VAGPIMLTPFSWAALNISLVLFSGIPSAMMAMQHWPQGVYSWHQPSACILVGRNHFVSGENDTAIAIIEYIRIKY